MCQATTAAQGSGAWVAACAKPRVCVYACGESPVGAEDWRAALVEMQLMAATVLTPPPDYLGADTVATWRNPLAPASPVDPTHYAQTDLVGNRTYYGLVRVLAGPAESRDGHSWEAIEDVLLAAAPHLLLTLQQEAVHAAGPGMGLCPADKFGRRVEGEVGRVEEYGGELSLAILEVQARAHARPGQLTPREAHVVAELLQACLRTSDVATRLPDGRFGILLPLTSQRNALIACARAIDALQASPELPRTLRCRTGLSGWGQGALTADDLFDQANHALQDARAAGATGAFLYL